MGVSRLDDGPAGNSAEEIARLYQTAVCSRAGGSWSPGRMDCSVLDRRDVGPRQDVFGHPQAWGLFP